MEPVMKPLFRCKQELEIPAITFVMQYPLWQCKYLNYEANFLALFMISHLLQDMCDIGKVHVYCMQINGTQ